MIYISHRRSKFSVALQACLQASVQAPTMFLFRLGYLSKRENHENMHISCDFRIIIKKNIEGNSIAFKAKKSLNLQ